MRADGRTNMTKLIVAFRNFANAPNKRNHKYFKICIDHIRQISKAVDLHKFFIRTIYEKTQQVPSQILLEADVLWKGST